MDVLDFNLWLSGLQQVTKNHNPNGKLIKRQETQEEKRDG